MHSGDMSELVTVDLSEVEKETLLQVMQRAKEFDHQSVSKELTSPLEGQLYKWTNPLKGWQPRWFYIDQQQGVLHYYTSADRRKQPPRGSLHLYGAVVAPSEEDSQSFSLNSMSGEIYKLRAADAKERQIWVSRLRREVEACTNQSYGTPIKETIKLHIPSSSSTPGTPSSSATPLYGAQANDKPDSTSIYSTPQSTPTRSISKRLHTFSLSRKHRKTSEGKKLRLHDQTHQVDGSSHQLPGGDAMLEVLTRLQCYQESLVAQLESYSSPAGLEPVDKNVLLLKATSQAALHSVKDCLALLKLQEGQHSSEPVATAAASSSSAAITAEATALKPEKPERPHSASNLEEFIDSMSDPRNRTQSMGRTTPRRSMTTTAV